MRTSIGLIPLLHHKDMASHNCFHLCVPSREHYYKCFSHAYGYECYSLFYFSNVENLEVTREDLDFLSVIPGEVTTYGESK
jgi:hypothetical protein